MALLADDVTVRMIAALRAKPQTAPQLEELAGSSQKKVAGVLDLLQAHGIVEWAPQEPQGPKSTGRPSREWRLAADEKLVAFERACDDFKASLLDSQREEYER
jgi:predicted ArsR family transcriptional regulator